MRPAARFVRATLLGAIAWVGAGPCPVARAQTPMPAEPAEAGHSSLTVSWSAGRASVAAQRASRARIVAELGARAGFGIRGLEWLPPDEITLRFSDVGLREVLRPLLSPLNFLLLEEASPSGLRPALVVIVPSRGGVESTGPASPPDRGTGGEPVPLEAMTMRTGPEAIRAALEAASAPDRDTRWLAIQMLSMDETVRVETMQRALSDDDREIRAYAMDVLAHDGSPEARYALSRVLDDPDPGVRHFALELVGHLADMVSVAYLERARRDTDPGLSLLAADLLARRERPAAAKPELSAEDAAFESSVIGERDAARKER